MPMSSISSAGCASTTTSRHSKIENADSTASIFTALHASIEAVLGYLSKVDPEAAKRARHHYSCFEQFRKEDRNLRLRDWVRNDAELRIGGR